MAVCIILAVVLLLLVLMFVPFKFSFLFSRFENENKTEVSVKYLFFRYKLKEKKQQPVKANRETVGKSAPERGMGYFKNIYCTIKKDVFDVIRYLAKRAVVLEKIDLKIDFGYSDAAATGLMTGILNGGAYNIISIICNNIKVKSWNVDIVPDFNNDKFDVMFSCIVRIKTVHIITVGIKALKMLTKIRKADKKGRG